MNNYEDMFKEVAEKSDVINYEEVVEKSNAIFEKTLKDLDVLEQRRKRIYSEAWHKYGDKELFVLTYRDRCFVMFVGENEVCYIATDPVTSEPKAEIWFELDNGQMDMHIRHDTVPACIAFKIVQEFIESGDMLSSVVWSQR